MRRFGYTREESAALYRRLSALRSDGDKNNFIAPRLAIVPGAWAPCDAAGRAGEMICRITIVDADRRTRLMEFFYDGATEKVSLQYDGRKGAPGAVLVAGAARMEERIAPAPEFPDIGVLLDPAGKRALLGAPALIRSTLVRLVYLGERGGSPFKSFDRRDAPFGDEVASWKISWPDD